MANQVLAVVKLQRVSGVPRDVVENTFALLGQGGGAVDTATAATVLASFYNRNEAITGGTRQVRYFINQTVSRAAPAQIEFYDIAAGGPPIDTHTFTLGAAVDGSALPDASCFCVTIHADLTGVSEHGAGTRPRARRRGRIYIGPLTSTEVVDTSSGVPRVGSGPRDTAGQALVATMGDLSDTAHCDLAVWSRVDNALRVVTGVWIDNRFDSQRRREEEATSRTVYLS